ncbi:DNA polymerase epsilon subunit [Bacillus sp. OxB-1]|uniref:hypothetical protein n=1 Tax=Bacillus sp. (strain OxB-1) TaxID=98228 RepID=UPI0005821BF5|nr:hypothetical protein [Bacillus sp. OxB-1]BAQ11357.1 DNA polymerase epsilon subunit [Bacillus sp. OxB-1]
MGGFFAVVGFLTIWVGIVMLVISVIRKKPKKKWGIATGIGFVLMMIGGALLPSSENEVASDKEKIAVDSQKDEEKKDKKTDKQEKEEAEKAKKEEAKKKEEAEKRQKALLNVEGTVKATAEQGKIKVAIDTNIPDGGLLEVSLIDGNFNHKSGFIKVKDGKAELAFDIPSDWKPAHFAASAMFRFNLDEHPQPDDIKAIFGETGDKMTGDLASENHLGGKNATFKTSTVAYPNEETVKKEQDKAFNAAISEMKEISGGIIVDVGPRHGEWSIVNVVVSDSWYYSAEHEKERFAEQIGNLVVNLVNNSGKYEDLVQVYFVDSYGADLATPKMLGGWKIVK